MKPAWKTLLALIAVLITVSCTAKTQWQKPGVTDREAQREKAHCRRLARIEAERRYGYMESGALSPGSGVTTTLDKNMAVFEAERHEKSLFENCLKGRGYSKAKKSGS